MKSLVIFVVIAIGMLLMLESATAGPIGNDEAIEILIEDIIKPSLTSERLAAYMLSEPLQVGDVVSSESGQQYVIGDSTCFIFIDDEPCAMFEHPVRYVFINATTGDYTIFDETWPPMINSVSMRDTGTLGRGNLIEIYSILSEPVPITGSQSTAPSGDYGDAPDGQDAYYGVQGSFPTLFYTTNSKLGRPGAHTLNIGQEMLGVSVSAEIDATDPSDPDGMPNLVDADSDERMFVIIEDATAKLAFDVTVDASAPDMTRYANVLIDFDQSGNWSGVANGKEWAIVNMGVNVASGTRETIITPSFSWGNNNVSPVWMRVSLTREQVNEALFGADGWDGSGLFEYGEIEDSLVFLRGCPVSLPPSPLPLPLPPGPNQICGCDIKYFALIIDGGEHYGRNGTTQAADGMYNLVNAQGYEIIKYLGPSVGGNVNGLNSETNIGNAINDLKNKVKCRDRVLIYIIGHGSRFGKYIVLQTQGAIRDKLIPSDLDEWLDGIPNCEGKTCDVKGENCYVSVVIESCYAGNFLDPLATKGRNIFVSSTKDQTSKYGSDGTGGDYSDGFIRDCGDQNADTNNDDAVDPLEAHESAKDYVKRQTPLEKTDPCDCVCPSVESSDAAGNRKDKFLKDEAVYAYGSNYSANKNYELYIVDDTTWTDGMAIPPHRKQITVTTDANGKITLHPTLIWSSDETEIGKYDIVVDVNGNGTYDKCIDALDDMDVNDAGFEVPSLTTIGLMALIGLLSIVAVSRIKRR